MKTFLSSAAAAALLAFGSHFAAPALAQQASPAAAPAAAAPANLPHKVALIDMAYVFQHYEKFQALRDEIKGEIEKTDADGKQKLQKLNAMQAELKQLVEGGFNETSNEYAAKEKALAEASAEFQTFQKIAQRDFLRKEADVYKQIYLEVTDMVQKYAKWKQYTLVLRFSRDNLDDASNPQETLQRMNVRQVIYHQTQDDLTDDIVKYLNQQYKQTTGGAPAAAGGAAAPAGTPRR